MVGPEHILKEDVPSKVSMDKLKEIREYYEIQTDIEIRPSEGDKWIDWVVEGWTPMYIIWLSLDLSFPITAFTRSFYKSLMITHN